MNGLVDTRSGTLITNSFIVSEGTQSQHASVIRLVRDNLQDFEEFGGVVFEIEPFETAGGTQNRTVAVLNREHAMLLMTYMRNTAIVRDFKKRLIRAFVELENTAKSPVELSRMDLLQMAMDSEKQRLELEARNKELEAPAKSWENLAAPGGDYSVAAAAKVLSRDPNIEIGRDRLFAHMKNLGWIFKTIGKRAHWEAYQDKGIKTGRLVHKLGGGFINEKTGEWEQASPTVRITPKGLHELHVSLGGSDQGSLEVA